MPLFNEGSYIYNPQEVDFMRACVAKASRILQAGQRDYSQRELSSAVMMLYESGMRDLNYIAELSARLAHQRYVEGDPVAANANNEAKGTMQ